jgi:hypothetical protein
MAVHKRSEGARMLQVRKNAKAAWFRLGQRISIIAMLRRRRL